MINPNRFSNQLGLSLFELVVVVCIVGFLSAVAFNSFGPPVENSKKKVVIYQANTFLRTIDNVRALGVAKNTRELGFYEGLTVYLNEQGWPIATDIDSGVLKKRPSSKGCASLWRGLFQKANSKTGSLGTLAKEDFSGSLINGYICRYKLAREQEESFFFDYDIRTGRVDINID